MPPVRTFRCGPQFVPGSPGNMIGVAKGVATAAVPAFFNSLWPEVVLIITHIHVINTDIVPRPLALWLGTRSASDDGTEIIAQDTVIQPKATFDWYGALRLEARDATHEAITGRCSGNATALSMTIEGEFSLM